MHWALGIICSASPISILTDVLWSTSTDSSHRNHLNSVASLAPGKGPVLDNAVIGLQIPCTHTGDNMQQNKKERNSSSRVCETIVRHIQWKTNIGWKWKFESLICSTLCADKRRGSAGALATTEYSKHKL